MTRRSVDLTVCTEPEWAGFVVGNFHEFLRDHANCERKASALAMSLVVKYPDRPTIMPALIELAQEELEHFRQVYALMSARGLQLSRDTRDPYLAELQNLMRHGRDQRFVDQMLVSSVVECRGAERFALIADQISDPELQNFYKGLADSEKKHGHLFVHLALKESPEPEVTERLGELVALEGEIIKSLPWRHALH